MLKRSDFKRTKLAIQLGKQFQVILFQEGNKILIFIFIELNRFTMSLKIHSSTQIQLEYQVIIPTTNDLYSSRFDAGDLM